MPKQKINAKELISDIRAGMDDPCIMQKYGLSSQGLQSTFTKLLNKGLIQQSQLDARTPQTKKIEGRPAINAKELAKDIRSGMSYKDIVHWYGLSSDHLDSVFEKLVSARLVRAEDLPRRSDSLLEGARTVPSFKCPSCGMPQVQGENVCKDCGILIEAFGGDGTNRESLSTKQERRIDSQALALDIRGGLDCLALAKKYRLSADILASLFKELVEKGLLESSDLPEMVFTCPACGERQTQVFDECPACGVVVTKQLSKIRKKSQAEMILGQKGTPEEADHVLVWVAAFVPCASLILDFILPPWPSLALVIVINTLLLTVDLKRLRKAGYDTTTLSRIWLLVPVYLFKRVRIAGGGYGYAVCWMITFFMTFLITLFIRFFIVLFTLAAGGVK